MTRKEFIDELRIVLQGQINQEQVNEHLRFYDNYIMEEARKGRTEQQIIEQLGNPRLIAKTLIDTAETNEMDPEEQSYKEDSGQGNKNSRGFQADYSPEHGWDLRYKRFKLNSWYGILLLIVIAVCVIILAANIVAFLLPIVIPVVLILVILSLLFGRRK